MTALVILRWGQVIYYLNTEEEAEDGESMKFKILASILWSQALLVFLVTYFVSFKFLKVIEYAAPCIVVSWTITGIIFFLFLQYTLDKAES